MKKHVLDHLMAARYQEEVNLPNPPFGRGAFQSHSLSTRARDATILLRETLFPPFLHLWKESGCHGLESIIFKIGLFQSPDFPVHPYDGGQTVSLSCVC